MNSLLSTAYWPNLQYFYYLFNSDLVFIEQFENYQKQSFRNRTQILSANGPLDLSLPVKKKHTKELTRDIEISYAESWQPKHWRAITSAYQNSPYFEHFENDIRALYSGRYDRLLDYNLQQIHIVLRILRVKKEISLTSTYEKESGGFTDLREKIHPKLDHTKDLKAAAALMKPYYQTFESKFDFIPNLSILDLIFNTGLGALQHLTE